MGEGWKGREMEGTDGKGMDEWKDVRGMRRVGGENTISNEGNEACGLIRKRNRFHLFLV